MERNKGSQVVLFFKGYFFSSFYKDQIDPPRARVLRTLGFLTQIDLCHVSTINKVAKK